MKTALILLAFLAVGFLGWSTWDARSKVKETKAKLAALQVVRDSAVAVADSAQATADSLGLRADSLAARLDTVRTQTAATVRQIETETDSLGNALKNALDSLGASDTLKAIVDDLTGQVSRLSAEYDGLLLVMDSATANLQARIVVQTTIAENLRTALAAKDQQTAILEAAWREALNPGWWGSLMRDKKAKAVTAIVAFSVGYAAGR